MQLKNRRTNVFFINCENLIEAVLIFLLSVVILVLLEAFGYLGKPLFRFGIEAEVQDVEVTLGGQLYVTSGNFEEAKKKAIRLFEESMIERSRNTSY